MIKIKKIVLRLIKVIFSLFIALVITLSVHFQIKVEKYITTQRKTYKILQNRERISYKPISVYYIETHLLQINYNINIRSNSLLTKSFNLKEYQLIPFYDEYIMECYYTDKEKEDYIKNRKK